MWFKAYYFIFLPQNIVTTFLGERSSGSSSSTFIAWIFYDQLLLLSTLEVLAALFLATSDEAAQARVCCREELHFPLDAHWTLSLIKKLCGEKQECLLIWIFEIVLLEWRKNYLTVLVHYFSILAHCQMLYCHMLQFFKTLLLACKIKIIIPLPFSVSIYMYKLQNSQ